MADALTKVPSFPSILTLIFIILKLAGYIAWSWWWVLSPLWIGAVAIFVIFFIILIFLITKDKIRG